MDTGLGLMLPGVLGGLVVALLLARLNRTPSSNPGSTSALEPVSPDLINMSHIRVAGVGGLGMMAAALVAALTVPEIGFSLLVAAALGAIMGGGLILYRSRSNAPGDGGQGDMPPGLLPLRDDRPATRMRTDRTLRSRAAAIA